MGKTEIKVSCRDQVLKITEAPVLASGGVNEVRIVFNFCEKWVGFIKTAIFYRDEEVVYHAVLDENDTCIVPWEVCYEEGAFYFGVFGDKDDITRTSNIIRYKVKKGAITTDMMPSAPPTDLYEQIIKEVANMRETTKHNIASIEKTGTNGLVDTYTITFVGGSTQTYTVTNGAKGDTGAQGIQGEKGEKGEQGIQGVPGTNGIDGKDGKDGVNGKDGVDGKDGEDGYTPVKGVDYFTPEEVQEIAEQAAEMVEVPEGGGVTSWNDLEDKPFGGGVLYEWKESTVYTETVTTPDGVPFELIEKISTDVPGYEFLINKTCSVEYEDDTGVAYATKYITADEIAIDTIADGYYMLECLRPSEYVSVTLLFCMSDSVNFMGLTLSKGVWAMGGINKSAFGVAPLVITITDVSCIDEKYIPDTIARTADVQTMIDNAIGGTGGGTPDAVQFVPQELTAEQQEQARKNIGAMSANSVISLSTKQINALDALFKAASYIKDVSAEYAVFCDAFGLADDPSEPDNPPEDVGGYSIKRGSVSFENGKMCLNGAMTNRGILVPIGQYLKKGTSYKFGIGTAANNYRYGVQIFVADSPALEFPHSESTVFYDAVTERTVDSGWIDTDYICTVDMDNRIMAVNFKKIDGTTMSEADYVTILENFTIEEVTLDTEVAYLFHRYLTQLNDATLAISSVDTKRIMVYSATSHGRAYAENSGSYWDISEKSPLRIPVGAVSANVVVPSGMMYGAFIAKPKDASERLVTVVVDTGWITDGHAIDVSSYNDGTYYFGANISYTSGAEISADFDTSVLNVYFVDADGNRMS